MNVFIYVRVYVYIYGYAETNNSIKFRIFCDRPKRMNFFFPLYSVPVDHGLEVKISIR